MMFMERSESFIFGEDDDDDDDDESEDYEDLYSDVPF
ncbi:hypothetical protein NM63023_0985 [Neisseria meningitidis 63023]|nr:hypothetical protein NM63023_1201 [Neisseria meningitidis 63023]EOB61092.1 hypothetical protein NM63023_1167 [Neisseria meningitidis 63023]EOB61536.1 hypothetical protein NM63023_0985 [Neisseria meningitidis 63023]